MKRQLILPQYDPRAYQRPFWEAMAPELHDYIPAGTAAKKRAALIWHRRAGKDLTVLNWLIYAAAKRRVGTYYYFFPTYSQGKKVVWDGADKEGKRFLDYIPSELVVSKNETEMQIEVANELGGVSIVQIVGTDRMDSVVGTNPVGCVFSEYSLQSPLAYDLVRPILRENGGWAVFVYTPRGKNHGYELYERVRTDPEWFTQLLTVRDTLRADGTPVITDADLDQERREGMDEELLQQEYFCSFYGSVQGAYFAKQIDQAEKAQRIGRVPHEPKLPVVTSWDLGIGDATAIWFLQFSGREVRVIDYLEASGEGLPHFARELKQRPYVYDHHLLPHDIEVRELATGASRREALTALGIRPIRVVPKLPLDDGIHAVRAFLARCWFDAEKCKAGLDSLRHYRKEWDADKLEFKRTPRHDKWSHGADAFRMVAIGGRSPEERAPLVVETAFNPLTWEQDRERGRTPVETEFEAYS